MNHKCDQCGNTLIFKGPDKNTFLSYEYCDSCCEAGMEDEIREAWEEQKWMGAYLDAREK